MLRSLTASLFVLAVALLLGAGCRLAQTQDKKIAVETMPDLTPTRLDYVDTDSFDAVLESALVAQDPIIMIRTGRSQPDWSGRLNAWIAAWNSGSGRPRTVRGQSALNGVSLDKDTVRELRLLVNDLLDRVEDTAQAGSTWYADHRQRNRRIALMKPYSLRFHMDDEGMIQVVLFHGNFAPYYARFLQTLQSEVRGTAEPQWTRSVECSNCKKKDHEVEGTLTSAHLPK